MTGQQDSEPGGPAWARIPAGPDGAAADDVLEQGGDRRPPPSWWPPEISRFAAVLTGAALLLGLGVGYLAGVRHDPRGAATAAASPASSASALPVSAGGPTLEQSGNRCSAQQGTTLQLGVELTNQSATPLTLSLVRVVLPLGGVRVTAVTWGPCGEIPASTEDPPQDDAAARYLLPGASGWLAVTVTVLVSCPGWVPVQFKVGYRQDGKLTTVQLPGFPDLSGVPYTGCRGWPVGTG